MNEKNIEKPAHCSYCDWKIDKKNDTCLENKYGTFCGICLKFPDRTTVSRAAPGSVETANEKKESKEVKQLTIIPEKKRLNKTFSDLKLLDDKKLLLNLYNIFSPSNSEHGMVAFVSNYLNEHNIRHKIDEIGNIYCKNPVKGNNRIILNAHMDTVASKAANIVSIPSINDDGSTDYKFKSTNNAVIGADDKNGVFAVLKLITSKEINIPLSGLLCVQEEVGCIGSSFAMEHHSDYFNDCVFNITIDRRGNNEIIIENCDVTLCSKEMEELLVKWGEPFKLRSALGSISDVSEIVQQLKINGINLFAGYYGAHSGGEYTIFSELLESIRYIIHILPKLHDFFSNNPKKIAFEPVKVVRFAYPSYSKDYVYSPYSYAPVNTKKSEKKVTTAVQMLADVFDDIELFEGYFAFEDLLYSDCHMSKSNKSLVLVGAWEQFKSEVDVVNKYITVLKGDNGNAVISIDDLEQYLQNSVSQSNKYSDDGGISYL